MPRRLLLGSVCGILLTLAFYTFNLFVTYRIADKLSKSFRISQESFLHIERIQTDFLSTLKLSNLDVNLSRYVFLTRLSAKEVISNFNIFTFVKREADAIDRVTIIGPKLYGRSGDIETGLKRLLSDMSNAKIKSRVEIQNGAFVLENDHGQDIFKIEDIWGSFNPFGEHDANFIFTNSVSSMKMNGVLIKGHIAMGKKEGKIHVTVKNMDLGKLLHGTTGTWQANLLISMDLDITASEEEWSIQVHDVTIHTDHFVAHGKGDLTPDNKGIMQATLDFKLDGRYHEGTLSITGPISKALLKGDVVRRNAKVNEGKILVKGYVTLDHVLKLSDLKIESSIGKVVLDGFADFTSMDIDFLIREKAYNDVALSGKIVAEAVFQDEENASLDNRVKFFLSKLKINDLKLSNLFIDMAFNGYGVKIYEVRGNHVDLAGHVDFEPDEPRVSLVFTCKDADLSVMKPIVMKGRSAAHLSGRASGTFTMEGHLSSLGGLGSFIVEKGSIGMIPKFEKMIFDFTWKKTIIILNDARIMREKDYFVLKNTIDLARHDIMETLTIEQVGETKEWEKWTINDPKPEVGLDIFGSVGHEGANASGGVDQGARKSLLDLEYDLKDGKELLFKIESDESFMGVGKKIEF